MPSNETDCYEEDEDVVIAGSQLHEALSKMGYSDYEVVSASNQEPATFSISNKLELKKKWDGWFSEILHKKLSGICRCMIKDSNELRKQLTVISEAQHLLDDHANFISNMLDGDRARMTSKIGLLLSCLPHVAVTTVGYYFINRSNPLTWLAALPALTVARYKYNKWRSIRNLKRLISEQTELYYTYKRALRILNHSFRMNTNAKQSGSPFNDLGAEKLKFLQPITERTVQSLGIMSLAYYQTTLRIAELLPDPYRQDFDSQITYFDEECFTNCGEVTYNGLKQMFYRFTLMQSEMLLSFAVLRHSDSNDLFNDIKRGMIIDHRVQQLLKLTTEHRISMMKTVDDFQKRNKLTAVENKYRGFLGSKWQDLYIRLHLTSHKMQKAYDGITSALEDIENHLDRRTDETELIETLKTRLDDVYRDVDKARDLAQLSVLVISKMAQGRKIGDKSDADEDNDAVEISRRDIPVVKDTEPEIIDEVFEEYIRERYSDALLNETSDDYLEKTCKLDKLLSKSLMSELKEALVEKQKDTSERESRALKRMGKCPIQETATEEASSGDPSSDLDAEIESRDSKQQVKPELADGSSMDESETEKRSLSCIPKPPPPPMPKEFNQLLSGLEKVEEIENPRPKQLVPLPTSGPSPFTLFLSNNEETFIGSGENSDEEVVGETEEGDDDVEEEEQEEEGN